MRFQKCSNPKFRNPKTEAKTLKNITADMLDEKSKQILARETLTMEQANAL
jgi:hypothetical protein